VLWGVLTLAGIPSVAIQWSNRLEAVTAAARVTSDVGRVRAEAQRLADSLEAMQRTAAPPVAAPTTPYIVVSADARHLWLRQGDSVLFESGVATGKGDMIGRDASFATPRRRFFVLKKETAPQWVPPDWHYQEFAASRGLSMARLDPSSALQIGEATIRVDGGDVVKVLPDGAVERFAPGKEVVIGGQVIIPPFGTRQRSYKNVLGAYRLNFGEGYGIHGTDQPRSIGQAASHGCIRMRNEDISRLVALVDVGTPVYIF
jgi:hypothetical protein